MDKERRLAIITLLFFITEGAHVEVTAEHPATTKVPITTNVPKKTEASATIKAPTTSTTPTIPKSPKTTKAPATSKASTTITTARSIDILLHSEGCEDTAIAKGSCGKSRIEINGKDFSPHGRGLNVAIIDYNTGLLNSVRSFDTHGDLKSGRKINTFINTAPQNTIIAVVAQDEGSQYFPVIIDVIKSIGGKVTSLGYRSSYALLGFKGNYSVDWKTEVYNVRGKGPSVIRKRIQLDGQIGPTTQARSVDLILHSEGCEDKTVEKYHCDTCRSRIEINGKDVSQHGRGLNIAIIDFNTGFLNSVRNFDTHGDLESGMKVNNYINGAPKDTIIAVVAQDEGSRLFAVTKDVIKSIGGTKTSLGFRSSYALLGFKGNFNVDWKTEVYNVRGKGPSVIRKRIQLNGQIGPTTQDYCKITTKGTEFRGNISTTTFGRTCQAWASLIPHPHTLLSRFPEAGLVKNYCRNPDNKPYGPWCHTMDSVKIWEYCRVPLCSDHCKITTKGTQYRGHISTTTSGKTCQVWGSQTPHQHTRKPSSYPEAGLENNYCRNPDSDPKGPWCYTMISTRRWEHCPVPLCSAHPVISVRQQCSQISGTFYTGSLIMSPNYPSRDYPNNVNCTWVIRVSDGYRIRIDLNAFKTERQHDTLSIYDGDSSSSRLVSQLSGLVTTFFFISSTDALRLQFRSDPSLAGHGFSLTYRRTSSPGTNRTIPLLLPTQTQPAISVAQQCYRISGTFYTGSLITSPHYPSNYYPNNVDCTWIIRVSHGYRIRIDLTVCQTELRYDTLSIFDGGSSSSRALGESSGSVNPFYFISSVNALRIQFSSDSSVRRLGFSLIYRRTLSPGTYTTIPLLLPTHAQPVTQHCSRISGTFYTGSLIMSPNYPSHDYPNNVNCTWIIRVPNRYRIRINVTTFNTERQHDTLRIYDGDSSSSRLVGELSGLVTPFFFISSINTLRIQFRSDSSRRNEGFSLMYSRTSFPGTHITMPLSLHTHRLHTTRWSLPSTTVVTYGTIDEEYVASSGITLLYSMLGICIIMVLIVGVSCFFKMKQANRRLAEPQNGDTTHTGGTNIMPSVAYYANTEDNDAPPSYHEATEGRVLFVNSVFPPTSLLLADLPDIPPPTFEDAVSPKNDSNNNRTNSINQSSCPLPPSYDSVVSYTDNIITGAQLVTTIHVRSANANPWEHCQQDAEHIRNQSPLLPRPDDPGETVALLSTPEMT